MRGGPSLAFVLLCLCLLSSVVLAVDNGLGITPPMGWNSWNQFACNVTADLMLEMGRALVSSGLRDAGYTYLNIDDCWAYDRFPNGTVQADPVAFPLGIAHLADGVHAMELKLGIYTDAGNFTCEHRPGSLGYEREDANAYAEWKVDYVKMDNCFNDNLPPQVRYPPMSQALNASGRHIFFSICEWGQDDPWNWAPTISNSWRTTVDILNSWESLLSNAKLNNIGHKQAGPGHWNDPDMLEVGVYRNNRSLSHAECRSHFALWCAVKAPLILGLDIREASHEVLMLLSNPRLIAINQDPLGVQAALVAQGTIQQLYSYWFGPLSDGYVLIMINEESYTTSLSVLWEELGLPVGVAYTVIDLWSGKKELNVAGGLYYDRVHGHDCVAVKLMEA